jgi:hypothetical protein
VIQFIWHKQYGTVRNKIIRKGEAARRQYTGGRR